MKILSIEKLTDEKWLNLFGVNFDHNGKSGRWVFASRGQAPKEAGLDGLSTAPPKMDAVVIVPVLREEGQPPRLVMIREFRMPAGGYKFGLPAGLVEDGESVEDAIRREIQEETGLVLVRIKRLTQGLYTSSGLTDEAVAMAFVDVERGPSAALALDHSEDIEPVLFTHDEVCGLCDDRALRVDVKAWMALYLYQQLGRLE
jgi:ADP-ribose pyrophosphatase